MPFTDRMMLKITQIARLRLTGVKDVVIARTVGLRPCSLVRILRTPDYKEYESSILQGHLSKMDENLANNRDLMLHRQKAAVSMAQRTIIEVAQQRLDLRSALSAAKEILDRDPDRTLVKEQPVRITNDPRSAGVPEGLFEAVSKDADGVAVSVSQRLRQINSKKEADA